MKYHVLTLTKDFGSFRSVIHPVALETEGRWILFDAGYPGQLPDFEAAFEEAGFGLSDLDTIVVSHHDHDHVGSLAAFHRACPGLRVLSSELDAPCISGERPSLRLLQAREINRTLTGEARAFGERFVQELSAVERARVDAVVSDGDVLFEGVRVVATPGHMPGHLSLFLEEEKVLLAADALAVEEGELVIANPRYALDLPEAVRSVGKIGKLRPRKIVCHHGHTWEGDVEAALDRIARRG